MKVLHCLRFSIIAFLHTVDLACCAFSDCPCVDTVNDTHWASIVGPYVARHEGKLVLRASGAGELTRDFASHLGFVPRNYGSSACYAWDAKNPRCESNGVDRPNAPIWCKQSWCYVDPSHCSYRAATRSLLLPGLFWSYETCGNVRWTKLSGDLYVERMARIKQLRIGYPESGWPAAVGPQGRATIIQTDRFIDNLLGFLEVRPYKISRLNVSSLSRKLYPLSSYTACAHDVGLGSLDLCAGQFFVTGERSLLTAFAPLIYTDLLHLYVRSSMSATSTLFKPFKPFSLGLWLVIFLIIVVSGVAIAFLEGKLVDNGFSRSRIERRIPNLVRISRAVYWAFIAMLSAAIPTMPKTVGGKLLSLGFAFFVLLTIASLTANTTSFLLDFDLDYEIGNLDEARNARTPVCVFAANKALLSQLYPGMMWIPVSSVKEVGEKFFAEECRAGILTKMMFSEIRANNWDRDALCQQRILAIGQPVLTLDISFPVSREILSSFSWAISHARENGEVPPSIVNPYGDMTCPNVKPGSSDAETQPLQPSDFLGVILVYGVMLVFAFMFKCAESNTAWSSDDEAESSNDMSA